MLERVVVLNDSCVARGGATGLALASATWLRDRGVPVTFITGDRGANADLARREIDVVAIGQDPLLQAKRAAAAVRGLYNRAARRAVEDWISRYDTPGTVYHLHGWSKVLSPSVFAALARVESRLILSAHDFFLVCPNGAYANFRTGGVCHLGPGGRECIVTNCDRRHYSHKVWRLARSALARRFLDLARSGVPILAIHERMAPFLVRGGASAAQIKALRNPVVPFARVRVPAERNGEILFVGRLDEEKGPHLLARAAHQVGAPLRMVGEGPLRRALESDFPEIRFEGWRTRDEIAQLCSQARLLVMPSRYPEPFGLVAVEALWSGIPVIVPADAFLAEDIGTLGVGRACDPADVMRLAATIAELMADDEAIARMSRRAFEASGSLATTPDRWTDELLAIYRQRVQARRRPPAAAFLEASTDPGPSTLWTPQAPGVET